MSAAPPSPPPPDEEEIARQAALAALNESIPLNNSLFANNSLTMQLQSEVFVLRHNFIDEADAIEFYEQAQRNPDMKLTDCMQKQAIELLNFKILVDAEFNIIDRRLRHDWFTILSVTQVATLVATSTSAQMVWGSVLWRRVSAKFPSTTRSLTTIMRMPHSFVTMNL